MAANDTRVSLAKEQCCITVCSADLMRTCILSQSFVVVKLADLESVVAGVAKK